MTNTEVHPRQTATSTPEQYLAGLTDFGPTRSKTDMWVHRGVGGLTEFAATSLGMRLKKIRANLPGRCK